MEGAAAARALVLQSGRTTRREARQAHADLNATDAGDRARIVSLEPRRDDTGCAAQFNAGVADNSLPTAANRLKETEREESHGPAPKANRQAG